MQSNAENEALRTLIESAPVLCVMADCDFSITFVNPFFNKVHNAPSDIAIGKHIKDLIGEEGFHNNLPQFERALQGDKVEYNGSFNKGTPINYRRIASA